MGCDEPGRRIWQPVQTDCDPSFSHIQSPYRAILTLDERLEEIGTVGGDRDIAGEREATPTSMEDLAT